MAKQSVTVSQSTLQAITATPSVSMGVIALLQHPLVEQLIKWRDGNQACAVVLQPSTIAIDSENDRVALTPEAYRPGSPFDEEQVLKAYGSMLLQALQGSRQRSLVRIASQCACGDIGSLNDLYTQLERRASNFVYVPLIVVITALLALLWWLNSTA